MVATTDWITTVPDPRAPADGRNYCLVFDGIDLEQGVSPDSSVLLMDSCAIESYPRPPDAATPDLEWGGSGTPFDDPTAKPRRSTHWVVLARKP